MGICNAANTINDVYEPGVPVVARTMKKKKKRDKKHRKVKNKENSKGNKEKATIEQYHSRVGKDVVVAKEPNLSESEISSDKKSREMKKSNKKKFPKPTNLVIPNTLGDGSEYEEMEAVDLEIPGINFPWSKEKVYFFEAQHVNELYHCLQEQRTQELNNLESDYGPKTLRQKLLSNSPNNTASVACQKISSLLKDRKKIVESLQKEYLFQKCRNLRDCNAPPKAVEHIKSECLKKLCSTFQYLESLEPETYAILKPESMTNEEFRLFETEAQINIALSSLPQVKVLNHVSVNYLRSAYEIYCDVLKQGYNSFTEQCASKIIEIYENIAQAKNVAFWRRKLSKSLKKRVTYMGLRNFTAGNFVEAHKFLKRCFLDYLVPEDSKKNEKNHVEETEEEKEQEFGEKLQLLKNQESHVIERTFFKNEGNKKIMLTFMESLVRVNKKSEAHQIYECFVEHHILKLKNNSPFFYKTYKDSFLEHPSFLKFLIFSEGGREYSDIQKIQKIMKDLRSSFLTTELKKSKSEEIACEEYVSELKSSKSEEALLKGYMSYETPKILGSKRKKKLEEMEGEETTTSTEEERVSESSKKPGTSDSEDEEVYNVLNMNKIELAESIKLLTRQISLLEMRNIPDQLPNLYSFLGQNYYQLSLLEKKKSNFKKAEDSMLLAIKSFEKSVSHYFNYLMNTKSFSKTSDVTKLLISRNHRIFSKKKNQLKNHYELMFSSPLFHHLKKLQSIQNFLLDTLILYSKNYVKTLSYLENNKIFRLKCLFTHGFIFPENDQVLSSSPSISSFSPIKKKNIDFDLSYLSVKQIKQKFNSIIPSDQIGVMIVYRLSKLSKFNKFKYSQSCVLKTEEIRDEDKKISDSEKRQSNVSTYQIHIWLFIKQSREISKKIKVIFKKTEVTKSQLSGLQETPNLEVQSSVLIQKIKKYIPISKSNSTNTPIIIIRDSEDLGSVHFEKLLYSLSDAKSERLGRKFYISIYDSVKSFFLNHSFKISENNGEVKNVVFISDSEISSSSKTSNDFGEIKKFSKDVKFWPITFERETSEGLDKIFENPSNRPKLIVFSNLEYYSDPLFFEDFQGVAIDVLSPLLENKDTLSIIHADFEKIEEPEKYSSYKSNGKRRKSKFSGRKLRGKGIGMGNRKFVTNWVMEWYRSIGGSSLLLLNSKFVSVSKLGEIIGKISEFKGDVRKIINQEFLNSSKEDGIKSYLYYGDVNNLQYAHEVIDKSKNVNKLETGTKKEKVRTASKEKKSKKKKIKKLTPLRKKNKSKN